MDESGESFEQYHPQSASNQPARESNWHSETGLGPEKITANLYQQIQKSPLYSARHLAQAIANARMRIAKEPYFIAPSYQELPGIKFKMVPLKKIIGSVSPSFKHWGNEYSGRQGRHQNIIKSLVDAARSDKQEVFRQAVNRIFDLDNQGKHGILLSELEGTAGPVYFVVDGTHRTSAFKALGLEAVPCQVKKIQIREVFSTEPRDLSWWDLAQTAGLLRGKIEVGNLQLSSRKTSPLYSIAIEKAVPPWVASFSYGTFFRFNRTYNAIYPNSFINLKSLANPPTILPEQIFFDRIAFNKFVSQQYSKARK